MNIRSKWYSTSEAEAYSDGIIEDDVEGERAPTEASKRFVLIARAAAGIAKVVPGFQWEMGTTNFAVTGELEQKVRRWEEEDRLEREEEERRRHRLVHSDDEMDVDDDEGVAGDASEDSDDEEQTFENMRSPLLGGGPNGQRRSREPPVPVSNWAYMREILLEVSRLSVRPA